MAESERGLGGGGRCGRGGWLRGGDGIEKAVCCSNEGLVLRATREGSRCDEYYENDVQIVIFNCLGGFFYNLAFIPVT
jgi:hypothetical protein